MNQMFGFKLVERGPPPRPGHKIESNLGTEIGLVTSGCPSPSLEGLGIGLLIAHGINVGDIVHVRSSAKRITRAEIVTLPFLN